MDFRKFFPACTRGFRLGCPEREDACPACATERVFIGMVALGISPMAAEKTVTRMILSSVRPWKGVFENSSDRGAGGPVELVDGVFLQNELDA